MDVPSAWSLEPGGQHVVPPFLRLQLRGTRSEEQGTTLAHIRAVSFLLHFIPDPYQPYQPLYSCFKTLAAGFGGGMLGAQFAPDA